MSVESVDAEWPDYSDPANLSPQEFCERYDLVPELTPFAHRSYEPWTILNTIADELESFHTHSSTFKHSYLFDDPQTKNNWWLAATEACYRVLGAWPYQKGTRTATRWVNPHYEHQDALAPGGIESRREEIDACLRVYPARYRDLAPRFGITASAFESWVTTNDIEWGRRNRAAKRRFARTLYTAAEWNGTNPKALIPDSTPHPYETIATWMGRFARGTEWSVPDDPSRTGRFDA